MRVGGILHCDGNNTSGLGGLSILYSMNVLYLLKIAHRPGIRPKTRSYKPEPPVGLKTPKRNWSYSQRGRVYQSRVLFPNEYGSHHATHKNWVVEPTFKGGAAALSTVEISNGYR